MKNWFPNALGTFGKLVAWICAVVCCVMLGAGAASATTFTGTVHNGTTGKPAANVDVVLLSLAGNMESVANTKTDAQGKYQLSYNSPGQMPLLVRAIYKGVNFHAMMPPGTSTADVNVYEPSTSASTVQMPTRLIVFQPNGSALGVDEIYSVQNSSAPPLAYFKNDGDFEFVTPDGADKVQVSAQGQAFSAALNLVTRGNRQTVVLKSQDPKTTMQGVSITLQRS